MGRAVEDAPTSPGWTIHRVAAGFERIDCWPIDVPLGIAPGDRFTDFVRMVIDNGDTTDGRIANGLFRARDAIGRLLRWDAHNFTRPIPGAPDHRVAERLTEAERASDRKAELGAARPPFASEVVYLFDDEVLVEVSNDTVHALLHMGALDGRVVLSVYVRTRGGASRAYMALIKPFRHQFVYPAWLGRLERMWRERPTV